MFMVRVMFVRPQRPNAERVEVSKNCFFKALKDTPRATNMLGFLVLVFPTPHEGGALLLRHDDKEWAFDSSKILADAKSNRADDTRSHIGYIAFYSDVEHEVAKVVSGHCVTITYNFYSTSLTEFNHYEAHILREPPTETLL